MVGEGRPTWRRLALVVVAWLIPLAFLGAGQWPFGLLIAMLVTLWVVLDARDGRQ